MAETKDKYRFPAPKALDESASKSSQVSPSILSLESTFPASSIILSPLPIYFSFFGFLYRPLNLSSPRVHCPLNSGGSSLFSSHVQPPQLSPGLLTLKAHWFRSGFGSLC